MVATFMRATLLLLIVAATFVYALGIPRNPPGFYIDESSICYNAWTISHNGTDESGQRWPLYFRAFGDYKNPTYIYVLAAVFRLAGPSISVARSLSAGFGFLTGALVGMLAWRMTRDKCVSGIAVVSALLTPWLFEPSRIVIETALYPAAIAAFLLYLHRLEEKPDWSFPDAIGAALLLALLSYTYSIGRMLAPLFALGLVLFCTRERWRGIVKVWLAHAVMLIPLAVFSRRHPGALSERFKIVTYLTRPGRAGEVVLNFLHHYLANLNIWRWLVSGDPNRDQITHIFGTPLFLLGTFTFAAAGAVRVLRADRHDAWWRYLFYALIVSVVPASLTNDDCHMLRLIPVPVVLVVFAVAGMGWFRTDAPRLTLLLLGLTIVEGTVLQLKFHASAAAPRRIHLFDADYREQIFNPAVASGFQPIYLADALAIPGYIQAYWYATLEGIPLSRFVRLAPDESAPADGLVISTEANCPRCNIVGKVKPYTLYTATGAPPPRVPLPEGQFRAELTLTETPEKVRANKRAKFRVRVRNVSGVTWLARERTGGKLQVTLGNHWYDRNGRLVVHDDGRSALLQDLPAGEERELWLTVNAPPHPGDYILEVDMLQEGVSWFALKGSRTARLNVQVR